MPFEFSSPSSKLVDQFGPFVEANYSNPVDSLELESRLEELADNQTKQNNLITNSKFIKLTLSIIGGVFVTLSVCAGVSLYLNSGLAGAATAV